MSKRYRSLSVVVQRAIWAEYSCTVKPHRHASLATTSIYVDLARDVMDKELQENAL